MKNGYMWLKMRYAFRYAFQMSIPIVKVLKNSVGLGVSLSDIGSMSPLHQLYGRQAAEIPAWSMLQSQPPVENDGTMQPLEIGDPGKQRWKW